MGNDAGLRCDDGPPTRTARTLTSDPRRAVRVGVTFCGLKSHLRCIYCRVVPRFAQGKVYRQCVKPSVNRKEVCALGRVFTAARAMLLARLVPASPNEAAKKLHSIASPQHVAHLTTCLEATCSMTYATCTMAFARDMLSLIEGS